MLSKILLGVGIFAAVFSVLIFSCKIPIGSCKQAGSLQGEVVMWGTLPDTKMIPIIQQFNPQVKTYRVSYVEVPEADFDKTLLEALANGTGPDLILAPYQIMLAESSRIYPYPAVNFGEKQFKDSYIDGADIFWTPSGALALPVSVEPMVLFYNRTLFSKHGIVNPPKDWGEVSFISPKLTQITPKGEFLESGIDLGAPNTPYAKDIIMAIVAQLGQAPVLKQYDDTGKAYFNVVANQPLTEGSAVYPLSTTVNFFTQFANQNQERYTWNQFSGAADDAFVAEKLAMYIGYSGEFESLKSRNPRARIEMAEFPQTKEYRTFATGMRMYGIAMLRSSRNPNAALATQALFAGGDLSLALSSIVGGVPAIRAYATTPGLSSVIASSMLNARGWQDRFSAQSSYYTAQMISDILNNRMSVTDAANAFVSRMQDMYTPLK